MQRQESYLKQRYKFLFSFNSERAWPIFAGSSTIVISMYNTQSARKSTRNEKAVFTKYPENFTGPE